MNKITLVAIVVLIGGGAYYIFQTTTPPNTTPTQTATTPITQMQSESTTATTCTERAAPSQIKYSVDDPRDYLSPFLNALRAGMLTNSEKETIKCFVDNPGLYTPESNSFALDLNKNFDSFSFSVANWTPDGKIGVSVSDPEFTPEVVFFYTRKINGQWKIVDITDTLHLLK